MKTGSLMMAAAFGVSFACAHAAQLDESAFTRKAELTVGGYAGSSTLENFPVLVRLSAAIPSFDYARCGENGADIRFADADGNLVPHEVDTWNTSGESLVWVRVPSLSGQATKLTLYCGHVPGTELPEVESSDVWSKYVVVIHGTGDAATTANATKHEGIGVTVGGTCQATTASRLGSGFKIAGSSNGSGLVVPDLLGHLSSGRDNPVFTISGWVKFTSRRYTTLCGSQTGWLTDGFLVYAEMYWDDTKLGLKSAANNNLDNVTSWKPPYNEWWHVTAQFDGATARSWWGGVGKGEATVGTVGGTSNWCFGNYGDPAGKGDSMRDGDEMDEWRVYDGAASTDWARAECDSMNRAEFVSVAAFEIIAGSLYAVTVKDAGGNVLATLRDVEPGTSVADRLPKAPDIDGKFFVRWEGGDYEHVTSDLTLTPVYVGADKCETTWKVWDDSSPKPDHALNALAMSGTTLAYDPPRTGETHDAQKLRDGIIKTMKSTDLIQNIGAYVHTGDSLVATFAKPMDIGSVTIWTSWKDGGRDGLTLKAVKILHAGAPSFTPLNLDEFAVGLDDNNSAGAYEVTVRRYDGAPLATDATGIQIEFGRMDNDYSGVMEIFVEYLRKTEWTEETFDAEIDRTGVGNLLTSSGATVEEKGDFFGNKHINYNGQDISTLYDKRVPANLDKNNRKSILIGDYSVLECSLGGSAQVDELGFWMSWDGGRDGIGFNADAIQVKFAGKTAFEPLSDVLLEPFQKHVSWQDDSGNASYGRYRYAVRRKDGRPLAKHVTDVRIEFGQMDNDGTALCELEVLGRINGLVLIVK